MLFLLRGVTWPYFKKHWVITLLTLTGVALGVGVYVAIELSSASLRVSLRRTVDKIAGKAQLEVSSSEAGVPETTVDAVRAVPGVAAAQPIIEAVVKPEGEGEQSLMVLGVDFLGDRAIRDWDFGDQDVLDDPLVFLAQPDSICVTQEFAARKHLKIDDTLRLETGHGYKTFTVRGLIKPEGPATAFGGNIALMDLYAAQFVFARGRLVDRVDVMLDASLPVAEGTQRLAEALGPGYAIDPPSRRGAEMEVLIENFGRTLTLGSWQAMFIAVFLIFNVFAVAAARRRREIGILRSLGVARGTILALFLVEGAIIGLVGSAIGLGAGMILARGTTRFIAGLTEVAYGLTHSASTVVVDPRVLVIGGALGLLSAIAAAFFPALAASRLQPVEALARGTFQRFDPISERLRVLAGIGMTAAAVAVVVLLSTRSFAWAVFGLLLINGAAVLLAPTLIGPIVRLGRPIMERLFGAEGRIATDTLLQAPRRTSATVLALMISLGFVLTLAGLTHAFRVSYTTWMNGVLNADFYVTASQRFFAKAYRLPPEFAETIAEIPGVRWVEEFRGIHLKYGEKRPFLATLPLARTFKRLQMPLVQGTRDRLVTEVPAGRGLAVSDNFAAIFKKKLGDPVTIDTPSGPLTLPIAAIVMDYSSDQGTVWMDRSVYLKYWKDTGVDTIDILLEPAASRDAVAREIRSRLAGKTDRLFVMTASEMKENIHRLLDQFFALSYIQLVIALFVAVLGITNTLVISVAERRRELGILKALGTERRQVAALIVLEALGISVTGSLIGYALGTYLIKYASESIGAANTGWTLPYTFPWGIASALLPLLVVVTIVAALYPAKLALSVSPAEALEFE
ncbi:MAG TPA: FtsX-like permease family protein [Candidatus Polarisedimenticolaceae bacterium]|nr:FtsX-like permease family protein [Candidatus Polarisedimenticolaceae bacterium]